MSVTNEIPTDRVAVRFNVSIIVEIDVHRTNAVIDAEQMVRQELHGLDLFDRVYLMPDIQINDLWALIEQVESEL